jgi:alkylation response protein AidB-like acyl-CoA dehydrogenase
MTAIAYEYPEEIKALSEGIAAFIKAEVIPRHEKNEKLLGDVRSKYTPEGAYSAEVLELIKQVRMAAGRAGYYAMSSPEDIGGGGLGYLAYLVAWEQIYHLCGAHYWLGHYAISHWAKGPSPVLRGMTQQMRDIALVKLNSGEHSMCFALSEPGAGSDAAMIKTRAEREGDGWRLTGTKIWITNSPYAQYAVIFAVTNPELAAKRKGGISAFMVPTSSKGFIVESLIKMWGHAGTDEAILRFDNIRVEPYQLVGELDRGFKIAMMGVGLGRIYNSARAVGLARWALEQAIDYVKVRETFGKKISEYQGVTFPIAEAATQVHAAHLMAMNAALLMDKGLPATKELSMAKMFAVEVGKAAVDRAMQTHGAMGFTNEMYLTEAYTSLRKVNVADGTNEILRHVVAKQLLAGDIDL